jgi:hypothetical protein
MCQNGDEQLKNKVHLNLLTKTGNAPEFRYLSPLPTEHAQSPSVRQPREGIPHRVVISVLMLNHHDVWNFVVFGEKSINIKTGEPSRRRSCKIVHFYNSNAKLLIRKR